MKIVAGRIVLLLFTFVASAAVHAEARKCPPMPAKYRDHKFGAVRFAIEQRCAQSLDVKEQLFVAGMAEQLRARCELPASSKDRAIISRFVASSRRVAETGRDIDNLQLDRTLIDQIASGSAFGAGMTAVEKIRCDTPDAALLSRGIVLYLDRSSSREGASRFVRGCTAFYSSGRIRHTEDQCRCLADVLRPVYPSIHEREYSPMIVGESIKDNPVGVVVQVMGCGFFNY